jgi:hypothetical protein
LQQKPLDSIMDLARAKTKSPEELTSIWDDVISKFLFLCEIFCLSIAFRWILLHFQFVSIIWDEVILG